jgi:hypothetical protein
VELPISILQGKVSVSNAYNSSKTPSFTESTRRRATAPIQRSPGTHSILVQSLPHNSSLVECLFGDDPSSQTSCIPGQQDALQMDIGLLVTNTYLGLNAPPEGQTTTSRCGDMFTNACPTGDAIFPLQAHNTGLIEEITSYILTPAKHTLPVILSAIIM